MTAVCEEFQVVQTDLSLFDAAGSTPSTFLWNGANEITGQSKQGFGEISGRTAAPLQFFQLSPDEVFSSFEKMSNISSRVVDCDTWGMSPKACLEVVDFAFFRDAERPIDRHLKMLRPLAVLDEGAEVSFDGCHGFS